jgi:hypothetical protein
MSAIANGIDYSKMSEMIVEFENSPDLIFGDADNDLRFSIRTSWSTNKITYLSTNTLKGTSLADVFTGEGGSTMTYERAERESTALFSNATNFMDFCEKYRDVQNRGLSDKLTGFVLMEPLSSNKVRFYLYYDLAMLASSGETIDYCKEDLRIVAQSEDGPAYEIQFDGNQYIANMDKYDTYTKQRAQTWANNNRLQVPRIRIVQQPTCLICKPK